MVHNKYDKKCIVWNEVTLQLFNEVCGLQIEQADIYKMS